MGNIDPIMGVIVVVVINSALLIFKMLWDHFKTATKENELSTKQNFERIIKNEAKIEKLREDLNAAFQKIREHKCQNTHSDQ